MTLRESAVLTAKWWGLLPHVIWRFPFRYFVELRNAYLSAMAPVVVHDDDGSVDWKSDEAKDRVVEFDREMFRGDAL